MKKIVNESGFSVVEIILLLVIVSLVGFIGWYVHHVRSNTSHNSPQTTSANTSTSSTSSTPKNTTTTATTTGTANTYSGWQNTTFGAENLYLRFPTGWAASTNGTTQGQIVSKDVSGGKLQVWLQYATTGLASNVGNNYKAVASFTYDGKLAYIVESSDQNTYYLSSCAAPKLCFFSAINQTNNSGIDEHLILNIGQNGAPLTTVNSGDLNQAIQIMESLTY